MLEMLPKYIENNTSPAKSGEIKGSKGRCCIRGCIRYMNPSYIFPVRVVMESGRFRQIESESGEGSSRLGANYQIYKQQQTRKDACFRELVQYSRLLAFNTDRESSGPPSLPASR